MTMTQPANAWRLETPGAQGWGGSVRPGAPDKYWMVSADCHSQDPAKLFGERIEEEYRHRVPRLEVDEAGETWFVTEGWAPEKIEHRKAASKMEDEDTLRSKAGRDPAERVADMEADGVDIEVVYPNIGLLAYATRDPRFSMAMARVWNRWALETYDGYMHRILPMAMLAPGDREGTRAEIDWAVRNGFRGFTLPCKPTFGPPDPNEANYNLPDFDWLWASLCEVDRPATFHVSTGRDPRGARGNGGAVVNYVVHSLAPTMEPMVNLCASGVCERFPDLRFALIETGVGWVPWALDAMDEAYKKHHMWVRPKLDLLPSGYFRRQGAASFQEDRAGVHLVEAHDLVDNFLWANDYPHQEGSWPHSAAAIERQMGDLAEQTRVKLLGLNAARIWGLEIPRR
jgi:predicted TIM-barrel fold metal-dependent hydrolase